MRVRSRYIYINRGYIIIVKKLTILTLLSRGRVAQQLDAAEVGSTLPQSAMDISAARSTLPHVRWRIPRGGDDGGSATDL